MDDTKQFETMAAIRAYANQIAQQPPKDLRPSTAKYDYADNIAKMVTLVKLLETRS